MTPADQFRHCMRGLAAVDHGLDVSDVDDNEWIVTVDGDESPVDIEIEIELDESRERVAMSTLLGRPAAERRADTCEILLTYNLLWQGDAPVRMAVASPGEEFLQVAELRVDAFEERTFTRVLSEFAGTARRWRTYVQAGGSPPPTPAPGFGHAMLAA